MLLLIFAMFAGFLGAMLGLGGGVVMVPVLTLLYHIDIHHAVAVSILSVVATSVSAAASFMKENLTNIRVGIFLQVATVAGALSGFLLSPLLGSQKLFILFGIFLIISAFLMLRKRKNRLSEKSHPVSIKLNLHTNEYHVDRPIHGFVWMYFAGIMSALLGIGSGSLKVLAMDGYMRLPIKVSTATSNFMIGVTASASAIAYLLQGAVLPDLAGPTVLGITMGSFLGAKALPRLPDRWIRILFVIVLFITAFQMILKGIQS